MNEPFSEQITEKHLDLCVKCGKSIDRTPRPVVEIPPNVSEFPFPIQLVEIPLPPIRITIEDWDGGLRESPVVEMQAVMMPVQPKKVTPDGALGVHPGPIVQRWAMAIAESQRMWYGEPERSNVQNKDNISEL